MSNPIYCLDADLVRYLAVCSVHAHNGDDIVRQGPEIAGLLEPILAELTESLQSFIDEALQFVTSVLAELEDLIVEIVEATAPPQRHPRPMPEQRRPKISSPLLDQRRRIRKLRPAGLQKSMR